MHAHHGWPKVGCAEEYCEARAVPATHAHVITERVCCGWVYCCVPAAGAFCMAICPAPGPCWSNSPPPLPAQERWALREPFIVRGCSGSHPAMWAPHTFCAAVRDGLAKEVEQLRQDIDNNRANPVDNGERSAALSVRAAPTRPHTSCCSSQRMGGAVVWGILWAGAPSCGCTACM